MVHWYNGTGYIGVLVQWYWVHWYSIYYSYISDTLELKTDSRIGMEESKLADPNIDVVSFISNSISAVVPNVILAKREVWSLCCNYILNDRGYPTGTNTHTAMHHQQTQ